jgi:hypothetical protein
MTKPVLLLLALCGLGDDSFAVRQASERYLAASGYVVVPLNRLAPYLTEDLQAKATLRRLEKRYYGAWGARLDRNDWREYPSLALLSPWCEPRYRSRYEVPKRFVRWGWGEEDKPLPLIRYYLKQADKVWMAHAFAPGGPGAIPRMPTPEGFLNGATLELLKDLRSRGAPPWVGKALLAYLRWRNASLERRYGVRDLIYSRR